MLKQPLFLTNFILVLIIGILHISAMQFFLYWTFPWFDNLMHFLGGLWFGIFSIWFFFFSSVAKKFTLQLSARNIFTVSIASVIVIGVLWEIFEIYAGVLVFATDYPLDTSVDLLMDTLGAVTASLYAVWKFQRSKQI
ncbi:MAG: hypothetical protein QGH26_01135 [Candidatus Pacebacteria bacterium]|nr:hypothetical protein [Candidatus Paceibacterota bacterium]